MIKLTNILRQILVEQRELDNVIEFPRDNFVLTIDRTKRQLIFSPFANSNSPSKTRTLLIMLKQNFKIARINSMEDEDDSGPGDTDDPNLRNVFQIEVDPREDFEAIIDFIKQNAGM